MNDNLRKEENYHLLTARKSLKVVPGVIVIDPGDGFIGTLLH